jgi:hypothetical protein
MHKHQGKVALVTGGSTGIGYATAQLLAANGAHFGPRCAPRSGYRLARRRPLPRAPLAVARASRSAPIASRPPRSVTEGASSAPRVPTRAALAPRRASLVIATEPLCLPRAPQIAERFARRLPSASVGVARASLRMPRASQISTWAALGVPRAALRVAIGPAPCADRRSRYAHGRPRCAEKRWAHADRRCRCAERPSTHADRRSRYAGSVRRRSESLPRASERPPSKFPSPLSV